MLLLVIPIFNVSFTAFVIVVLGVWRITHLLWGEDGPGDIFVRVRRLAGKSFFGRLLDCFYCLSLWVAAHLPWRSLLPGSNAPCFGSASQEAQFFLSAPPSARPNRRPRS